jgi:CheY-like chemotaxis protein
LGLSMAYGFVKQSGGHIKIDSEPDQGTTVKIYLPRSTQAQADAEIPHVLTGPIVGGKETILVVEDSAAVQATVVDMLTVLGYGVLKAENGERALAIIESGVPIDILFTDVIMPGKVRSPDLVKQAKLLIPNLAVLFTSGYTQDAIMHDGRLDPGIELLSKPYRHEELARKVRHMLVNKQEPRVAREKRDAGAQYAPPVKEETSLRILVVEDNVDAQQLVCELLMAIGHIAQGTSTAEEAIKILTNSHFDVLFTDVNLPGMSGLDLARKTKQDMPDLKVIFVSGYGRSIAEQIDFQAVLLLKPYDLIQLQKALAESSSEKP